MKYDVVVQPRGERDIQLAAHWKAIGALATGYSECHNQTGGL